MAQDQVALQGVELVGIDLDRGELAEAGIDSVDGPIRGRGGFNNLARLGQPVQGLFANRNCGGMTCDGDDVLDGERLSVEQNLCWHAREYSAGVPGVRFQVPGLRCRNRLPGYRSPET